MRGDLPRRRFIQAAASSAAAAGAASCSRSERSPWRTLSSGEAAVLAAVCDQIIPTDEYPSASQAGVLDYIDRQLTRRFKPYREQYARGLEAIDAIARRVHATSFERLTDTQQFELLTRLDEGQVPDSAEARSFFTLLVSHTMQGYYGPPRHGGNRDAVSWAMLRVATRPVRGRQPV